MRDVFVSQFTELHHSVQVRVVSEMALEHDLFPDTEMARMNGDTTVLACSTLSDVCPVSFLFAQVETGRVCKEDPTENETWDEQLSATYTPENVTTHTDETKPTDNPELGVIINVVVQDGRRQSTQLSHGRTETMSSRSNGDREDFGGNEESGTVGTELLEKSGQEIDGLETVNVCGFPEVVVSNSGNELKGRGGEVSA